MSAPEKKPFGVGIPAAFEAAGPITKFDIRELDLLHTHEQSVAAAFRATGSELGEPLYAANGCVIYRLVPPAEAAGQPDTQLDLEVTTRNLSNLVQQVQQIAGGSQSSAMTGEPSSPSGSDATGNPVADKQLPALRKVIKRGPPKIMLGGSEIQWAGALKDGGPTHGPRNNQVSCRVMGKERHFVDSQGHRSRPQDPDEAEGIEPGMEVEMDEVRNESVLIVDRNLSLSLTIPPATEEP